MQIFQTNLSWLILGIFIGFSIGYLHRELLALTRMVLDLEENQEKKPEPKPKTEGVTLGSYRPANETKQSSAVITPKTPQQLEYLANDRMRKEGLDVGNRQRQVP